MAEFGANFAVDILGAVRERAAKLTAALARALGGQPEIELGESGTLDLGALPAAMNGPGLAFAAKTTGAAVFMALPEDGGLIPDWCASPDARQAGRLADLARELAVTLLPESLQPTDCRCSRLNDLAAALRRGQAVAESQLAQIPIRAGDQQGVLFVAGPLELPDDLLQQAVTEAGAAAPPRRKPPRRKLQYKTLEEGLRLLPNYSRSLLKIRLPAVVTLASTKQPVRRILELGPGSIIQFDKSCDETLSLGIGNQEVAVGEAVKVGDKFGLRITSMIAPEERFQPIKGGSDSPSSQ